MFCSKVLLKNGKIIIVCSKNTVIIEYFCNYNIQNVLLYPNVVFDKNRICAAKIAAFFTSVSGDSYYGRTNFCEVKKYEKESRARVRRTVV